MKVFFSPSNENNPSSWLSCINEKVVGAVTGERLREIYGEDERMIATIEKDTCKDRDECLIEIDKALTTAKRSRLGELVVEESFEDDSENEAKPAEP